MTSRKCYQPPKQKLIEQMLSEDPVRDEAALAGHTTGCARCRQMRSLIVRLREQGEGEQAKDLSLSAIRDTRRRVAAILADGTADAARRLKRVLWNDPATGVMRHADAGYDMARDCAREFGLDLPSLP
jgi:hypothetical protein